MIAAGFTFGALDAQTRNVMQSELLRASEREAG